MMWKQRQSVAGIQARPLYKKQSGLPAKNRELQSAAGATLLLQALGYRRAQAVPAFLMGAGMTGIAGWVAFGPGPRRCQASFGGFGFIPPERICRTAFGMGALLLGVIAWLMLRSLLRREPESPDGAA